MDKWFLNCFGPWLPRIANICIIARSNRTTNPTWKCDTCTNVRYLRYSLSLSRWRARAYTHSGPRWSICVCFTPSNKFTQALWNTTPTTRMRPRLMRTRNTHAASALRCPASRHCVWFAGARPHDSDDANVYIRTLLEPTRAHNVHDGDIDIRRASTSIQPIQDKSQEIHSWVLPLCYSCALSSNIRSNVIVYSCVFHSEKKKRKVKNQNTNRWPAENPPPTRARENAPPASHLLRTEPN